MPSPARHKPMQVVAAAGASLVVPHPLAPVQAAAEAATAAGLQGPAIGERIRAVRVAAVTAALGAG